MPAQHARSKKQLGIKKCPKEMMHAHFYCAQSRFITFGPDANLGRWNEQVLGERRRGGGLSWLVGGGGRTDRFV